VCVRVCVCYKLRKRLILSLETERTKGNRLIFQPCNIQGVSAGIVNILGGGSMDYSE